MTASLTKPIIVPEWDSGQVLLYTPSTAIATLGQPIVNPNFTVGQSVLGAPFGGRTASPNVCIINGTDLFIAVSGSAQGVFRLPGYLADPVTAKSNAVLIDEAQGDYVGLAIDAAGNLFAAAGPAYGNNNIIRYTGGATATGSIAGVALGNGFPAGSGQDAYFGDMVFDLSGNLWAPDYWNNRLVVFAASSLAGSGPATWLALTTSGASLELANTAIGMTGTVALLFASPEGVDFDSFGANSNLWVGNNNDGQNPPGLTTTMTTLVQLTPGLQAKLLQQLQTNPNTTVTIAEFVANTDFKIYQVPNYAQATGSMQWTQFGGLQIDKATGWLYVNDETSDPSSGWVRAYDIATLAAISDDESSTDSQLVSNAVADQKGNGGIALLNLGPYVQDDSADPGLEPDTTDPNPPWESTNIVATIFSAPNQTTLPVPYADPDISIGPDGSDTVLGGTTRNIYVQVNNFGTTQTTGLEQLNLYWGKASSTLNWPVPWDGSVFDLPPYATSAMGGIIQLGVSIPPIGPSQQAIVGPVSWNTPDPTQYTVQDGHFCLLARIVTPNANYAENQAGDPAIPQDTSVLAFAGMSFPEGTNVNTNVVNNARIAWRNIHIVATEPAGGTAIRIPPSVVAINHGIAPLHLRIGFELLDADRRLVREPPGQLHITATGKALDILERSALGRLPRHDAARPQHGRIALTRIAEGIDRIRLEPGENLAFHVEYAAPPGLRDYAVRAKAFAQEAGTERLIGGQTFVYGHVAGFSTKPRHRTD
jgi:hypothetical protein